MAKKKLFPFPRKSHLLRMIVDKYNNVRVTPGLVTNLSCVVVTYPLSDLSEDTLVILLLLPHSLNTVKV